MAVKRHRLAQRRKALGFTQERLAERLGVDPKTIRRWESGETAHGPQPWVRVRLARCLEISAEQLEALLEDDASNPAGDGVQHLEPWQPGDEAGHTDRHDGDAQSGVFVPIIVNGHPVLVPLDGSCATTDWNAMNFPTRRSVLGYGVAASITSVLGSRAAGQILQAPTASLTAFAPPQTSWARPIYDAVLNPMEAARRATSADDGVQDLPVLRGAVDRAMRVSLSSAYGDLAQSLPTLIGSAEAAAMQSNGDEPAVHRALSDVYAVVGWMLIKADDAGGAWIAAQRAIQAAEHADDVLRLAAATRCLAEVHMRAGNYQEATRTALLAAVQLESAAPGDKRQALALRGAALLSAAAASARSGERREAHAALKAAMLSATELGQDAFDLATVFGPTNVAIHQVAIAVELGDAQEALRHIPAVQLDGLPAPLTERRARFLIDVARSYAQAKDPAAATDALLQAETIAPDELHHHRLTHELVPQMLARKRPTSDLRALATRCQIPV